MHSRLALSLLALPLAALALVGAGCGSGSASPGVASLGGTGTTSTSSGAPAGDAGPSSSSGRDAGTGGSLVMKTQNALQFAQCMRSHGVPNFPDSNGQGEFHIGASSGLDPGSARFQAALTACQKVLPNGGQPTPQQLAKARRQALAFSACMRRHGVPDFPDPNFSSGGGGIGIRVHVTPGGDQNPQSPIFQAAMQACQGHLPFKGAGLRTSAGGK
jgi:hypothetical protein